MARKINKTLNFEAEQELASLPRVEKPLTFSIDESGSTSLLDNRLNLGFDVDSTIQVVPFIDFGKLGKVDYSYPIEANFELPDDISAGEKFAVDTFDFRLSEEAKIGGKGLNGPLAGLDLTVDIEESGISNLDVQPQSFLEEAPAAALESKLPEQLKVGPLEGNFDLFTITPGGGIQLDELVGSDDESNDRDRNDNNDNNNDSDDESNDDDSNLINLPGGVDIGAIPPAIDQIDIKERKQDGSIGEFPSIQASAETGTPFASINGGLFEIAGNIPSFAALKALSENIDIGKGIPGANLSFDYSLLSANLDLGVDLKQTFKFAPEDIQTTLSVENGSSQTKPLGETFKLEAPSDLSEPLEIDANFQLEGELKSNFSLVPTGTLTATALGTEAKLELGPVSTGFQGKLLKEGFNKDLNSVSLKSASKDVSQTINQTFEIPTEDDNSGDNDDGDDNNQPGDFPAAVTDVSASPTTLNETDNNTVTFTIETENTAPGDTVDLNFPGLIDNQDVQGTLPSTATVEADGTASIDLTFSADETSEDTETFILEAGIEGESIISDQITVKDTSDDSFDPGDPGDFPALVAFISTSTTTVNETDNNTITFTIETSNAGIGDTVDLAFKGDINSQDIQGRLPSTATVEGDGNATVDLTFSADRTTEGKENFALEATIDNLEPVSSGEVTVNDSSNGDDDSPSGGDGGDDQPPEQVNTISLIENIGVNAAGTNGEKDIFQLDLTGFANTGNFNFGEDQIVNYNPDDGDVIQFINAPEDLNEIDELTNFSTGATAQVTAVNSASPAGTALTFEPSGFENSAEVVLAGEQFEFDAQPSVDQLINEVGVQFEFQSNQQEPVNEQPRVNNPISDQNATEGKSFQFQVPDNTFSDPDDDNLNFGANLNDNGELPNWLSFNADNRTFSGTPGEEDDGSLSILVTAEDSEGATVDTSFNLNVEEVEDEDDGEDDVEPLPPENPIGIPTIPELPEIPENPFDIPTPFSSTEESSEQGLDLV